jgi:hypothetical protein
LTLTFHPKEESTALTPYEAGTILPFHTFASLTDFSTPGIAISEYSEILQTLDVATIQVGQSRDVVTTFDDHTSVSNANHTVTSGSTFTKEG